MPQKPPDSGDIAAREYDGIYCCHWEGGGFDVVVGRWFFGVFPKHEYWQLRMADGVAWPEMKLGDLGANKYRFRFFGRRGPRKRCGHMGICHREATVLQVLECTPFVKGVG